MARTETKLPGSIVQITTKTPPTRFKGRMQTGTPSILKVDVAALEKELLSGVRGEVRFSAGDRGMYASDAGNYRMVAIGIVVPKDAEDVLHTLAVAASTERLLSHGVGAPEFPAKR